MTKREIDTIVYDNISAEIRSKTESMSQADIVNLLIETVYQKEYVKKKNQILRNANFGSKSDHIQLQLFNPEDYEIPENYQDFVDQQIEKFNEKHLEDLKLVRSQVDEKIAKIEKRIALDSEKANSELPLAPQKKKSVKDRQADVVVDYTVKEENCPKCGSALVSIGVKTRWKIEMSPILITLVEERIETKKCSKNCTDENDKAILITAKPEEESLIPGSMATESLVASLASAKFDFGLPFYRLERMFHQQGIDFSRQTMSYIFLEAVDRYLIFIYEQIRQDFKKCEIVHLDETTLKCLQLREERKTSYMIVGVSGESEQNQMAVYSFSPTRKQEFVTDMLGDDFTGVVMSDGYRAYANYQGITHLQCMAHARRKVKEALICRDDYQRFDKTKDPKKRQEILEKNEALSILIEAFNGFNDLYRIEEAAKYYPAELKLEMRQEISVQIFEKLANTMTLISNGFPKGSHAAKAADYFLERKASLAAYLGDGRYPIDNNLAERLVKKFVLSRKNFLFSNTERGAHAAAVYMTVIQTALMNGLNPIGYMIHSLKTLKNEGLKPEVVQKLLPYSDKISEDLRI